jgi:NEDD8-activating enzyme E1 regulatory subunit
MRLQVFEHYVIEAHPDDSIPDLRLDRPLTGFVEHCNSIDMLSLTREEHLHLPSLIVLFKSLQLWQEEHNRTDLPRTRPEKEQFKGIIDRLSHHSAYESHDQHKQLENFEEAKRTIPSRLVSTTLPSALQALFQDPSCSELTEQTNIFWFIIHALKLFTEHEGEGLLPVRGEIPDMITNTSSYVQLVKIYQEQSRQDCDRVHNYLLDLLDKYNASLKEQPHLSHLLQTYCKNAAFLKVLRTSPIKTQDETRAELSWYIGLHMCDLFYDQFNRYPGESSLCTVDIDTDQRQLELDLIDLKQISKKQQNVADEQVLEELCRYGGSEIHSIAAFLGGCCAQEAIKLITHQYVPIDNTLIYNGIEQSTSILKL